MFPSIANTELTVTSLELLDVINEHRVVAGKGMMRHDNFMAKIRDEFGDAAPEFSGTALYTNGTGGQVEAPCFHLNQMRALRMGMRESSRVRGQVCDWIENRLRQETRPMSSMEMLHQMTGAMVEQERRLAQQEERTSQVESAVAEVQHRLNSRAARLGYILVTDAKRRHCPALSDATVKLVVELKQVPKEQQFLAVNGFETQVLTVEETAFMEAIREFYSEIQPYAEDSMWYTHVAFPGKRFKA